MGLEIPKTIPGENFRKSRNPEDQHWDVKIPKIPKSRGSTFGFENSQKSRNPEDPHWDVKIPRKFQVENPEIPGIRHWSLISGQNLDFKIPSKKFLLKNPENPGVQNWDFKIPKKSLVKNPEF